MSERRARLVAYHEAGHALVGALMPDYDPVQKISIIPRGNAGGLTFFTPSEERMESGLYSRAYLQNQMAVALGGRVAEEIVYGEDEVTTGASNDLQQVASTARQMITRFGMSELGPLSLEAGNQEVFLGRDLMTRSDVSDSITNQIDEQVRSIVERCYKETVALLADQRDCMDRLVELLIEKETLDGDDFRDVVAEFVSIPEKDRFSPLLPAA